MTEVPGEPAGASGGAPPAGESAPHPGGTPGSAGPPARGWRGFLSRGPNVGDIPRLAAAALRPLARRWAIPVALGLGVALGAWISYRGLEDHQEMLIYRLVDAEVARVDGEFAVAIERRLRAIRDLAARAGRVPARNASWEEWARPVLGEDLKFRAVAWFDSSFEVRAAAPTTARLPGLDLDPQDDQDRRLRIETLAYDPETALASVILLAGGRRQVLVRAPVHSGQRLAGVVVGVIRLRDLLDELTRPSVLRGFAVAVHDGPYLLFGPVWMDAGDEAGWERDVILHAGGLTWMVQLWPAPELLARLDSSAPEWVLAGGLLLALAVALGADRLRRPSLGSGPARG